MTTSPSIPTVEPAAAASGVSLMAVALRRLEFRETFDGDGFAVPSPEPPTMQLNIEMAGQISVYENEIAQLTLDVSVAPDPAIRPLFIRLQMSAMFQFPPNTKDEFRDNWIKNVGALILYPYVRETVSSVTQRSVFPAVLLDPMPVRFLSTTVSSAPPSETEKKMPAPEKKRA